MLYIWPNCPTTKGRCAAAAADIIGRGKGAIDLQCRQAVAPILYYGAPLYHVDGMAVSGTAGAKEEEEEEWDGRLERGRRLPSSEYWFSTHKLAGKWGGRARAAGLH